MFLMLGLVGFGLEGLVVVAEHYTRTHLRTYLFGRVVVVAAGVGEELGCVSCCQGTDLVGVSVCSYIF